MNVNGIVEACGKTISAQAAIIDDLKADVKKKEKEIDKYKLELRKIETDLNKNDVDRYKNELKAVTAQAKLKAESDKNEMDGYKREMEGAAAKLIQENYGLSMELEKTRAAIDEYKVERDKSAAAFKDVITLKNAKIRQLEVELAKVRAESDVYQKGLNSKIAAESNSVVAVQKKIDNVEKMLKKKGDDNAVLRGLIKASEEGQKNLVEKLEKMNLDPNCRTNASDATFRARFTEISKLTSENTFSSMNIMAGFDWAIAVRSHMKESTKYFSAYLYVFSVPQSWSCTAFFTIKLVRQGVKGEPMAHTAEVVFQSKNTSWGWAPFITFEELLRPSNGYVKDDSIIMEADLKIYPV